MNTTISPAPRPTRSVDAKGSTIVEAIALVIAVLAGGVALASLGNPVMIAVGLGVVVTVAGLAISWAAVTFLK